MQKVYRICRIKFDFGCNNLDCMNGIAENSGVNRVKDCLLDIAKKRMTNTICHVSKTHLDDVSGSADYAVAWAGGFIFDRRARTCFNSS